MSANLTTDAGPLRRRPVQQRSAARVERMLEACAKLIDEVGYDGVTTTLIAERAGVAVGSLYQFFPDKRAVVQALTTRNLDRFMELISQRWRPPSWSTGGTRSTWCSTRTWRCTGTCRASRRSASATWSTCD